MKVFDSKLRCKRLARKLPNIYVITDILAIPSSLFYLCWELVYLGDRLQ